MASDPLQSPAALEIVARPSREYRIKRYLMVFILAGSGLWFMYDGYIGYPAENALIAEKKLEKKPHSATDLAIQRWLGWLVPIGVGVLVFALYNSRGRYVLKDNVLNVPGHPPVPLEAIRSIDKTDWDRKGIAYINYELDNGTTGRLRLDDFIYERKPTDEIFKKIEEFTGTSEA